MPAFEAAGAGNAIATRAARGDHPLVFGQDDRGDGLLSLSPSVFTGGGAVPVRADLGQFASLLLDSVARLSRAGAPTKTLATHRCSDVALDRLWSTALQILDGKPPPEKFFFFTGQRGEFIGRLRNLRASATPAQLARFEISDADLEPISCDVNDPNTCAI